MYYVDKYIKELHRIKCKDDRQNVLRLDMNENPIGLPAEFVERVRGKITPELLAAYPVKEELISLIAEHDHIGREEITVTAGSEEAMRLIFQTFGEEGKEILTAFPTFEMYDVYSKMFGMSHVTVDFDDEFRIDAGEVLAKINDDTGIIILLNPNSPIGTAFTEKEFRAIAEKGARHHSIVVVDEAYHYFYDSTAMELASEYDNVIVLRTFSKLCSIAGLRVGYAAADPQLIHYIENAQSTFNVNNVGLLFASEILKNPQMMDELIRIEREGHAWIYKKLCEKGYHAFSANGNYVLFYPVISSGDLILKLKEHKIWVRDYNKGILKGWIRVSTGDKESMKKFFDALVICDK